MVHTTSHRYKSFVSQFYWFLWQKCHENYEVEICLKSNAKLHGTWLSSVKPLAIADNVQYIVIKSIRAYRRRARTHARTHMHHFYRCMWSKTPVLLWCNEVNFTTRAHTHTTYYKMPCTETLQLLPFHVCRPKFYDYTVRLSRFFPQSTCILNKA